jgi:hypothetical protein
MAKVEKRGHAAAPAARLDSASPGTQPKPTEMVTVLGYILAVSYPLLALSTGVRALFQIFFKEGVLNYMAPSLSLAAALCYLTATIGFAYRARWAWRLSVGVLAFETALTLLVGALSLLIPATIGRTVWRHFGADYGYFPLFQPLIGLIWLFWPSIKGQYGLDAGPAGAAHTSVSERIDG